MRKKGIFVLNNPAIQKESVPKKEMSVDLEEAIDLTGTGKFQVWHCALMLGTLATAMTEMVGMAFILPAAACDLELSDSLRGILTSIPNIGIILTAPFWGFAADSYGRKPVLIIAALSAGVLGLLASFMPNLNSFAVCKFVASLFLACPSSIGFAYAGEMISRLRRDRAMLLSNGILMLSSIFTPVIAWGVLSIDWMGLMGTAGWRVLTAMYAIPLIISGLLVKFVAKESPKFLVTKGKNTQALEILREMFSINTGLPPSDYCVTSLAEEEPVTLVRNLREYQLKPGPEGIRPSLDDILSPPTRQEKTCALFRPPHLKWFLVMGFLMFGVFSSLNGLFLFAPDTINKVMSSNTTGSCTLCTLMSQQAKEVATGCTASMSNRTFLIMVVTFTVYSCMVMGVSLLPIDKRTVIIGAYVVTGAALLVSAICPIRMVAAACMTALQLTANCIGPLMAYTVNLFPTKLRGMAVGAVLMCGRLGAVVGANVAGLLLPLACFSTFLLFTCSLFLCAAVSFVLPRHEKGPNSDSGEPITRTITTGHTART